MLLGILFGPLVPAVLDHPGVHGRGGGDQEGQDRHRHGMVGNGQATDDEHHHHAGERQGEAEIEGADHGAMTLGTKKGGLLRSHEREGQTSE